MAWLDLTPQWRPRRDPLAPVENPIQRQSIEYSEHVGAAEVIIEERLKTTGLSVILGIVLLLVVGIDVTLANTLNGGSAPIVAQVVLYGALLLLILIFLISFRVVVRVVKTPTGRSLVVVYGVGGLVRQSFDADQITSASAREFSLLQMGGWGYRGSLKLMRRAALVTRRGEALELLLSGDRRFIVTVDKPEDFVAALKER